MLQGFERFMALVGRMIAPSTRDPRMSLSLADMPRYPAKLGPANSKAGTEASILMSAARFDRST